MPKKQSRGSALIARSKAKPNKAAQKAAAIDELRTSVLEAEVKRLRTALKRALRPKAIKVLKGKATKHEITFVIPDSHGNLIDIPARDACIRDLARIKPERIVMLGDHLDCGGTFNAHQRTYTKEMTETYEDDVAATNEFLDLIRAAAPNARIHYLEGNHEQHCERFLARNFHAYRDAEMLLSLVGPQAVLHLKEREVEYYRTAEFYDGISIPGTIRIGKMHYTHGISSGQNAAAVHLSRFGASVFFGHCHRSASVVSRTVTQDGIAAYNPGTLAKLQPVYMHSNPSGWSHGYGTVTTSMASGNFSAQLVPILNGISMLFDASARA
jgi:hypothetical protein